MNIANVIIVVEDIRLLNGYSIQNSINLSSAISKVVTVVCDSDNQETVQSRFREIIDQNDFISEFKLLHGETISEPLLQFDLCTQTLIIVIGDVGRLYGFIGNQDTSKTNGVKWQVISSEFARFQLLEGQQRVAMSLPADTKKWISNLVKRYGIKSILNYLKQVSELKVCLIGDSIIDEYIFTEALGKSSKDPLLAFQIKDKISIPGGIMAVARHIDGLNAKSTVFTALNDRDSLFLEAFFSSNTKLEMLKKASITTTRKSRYVDKASSHRVFETYEMGDSEISPDFLTTLNSNSQKLKDANIVMVFDYGHSLIDDSIVNYLRDFRGKASVNAQRNAGNRGLNSISKYRGFPTMYMNGGEVTAEMRQRSLDMPSLLKALLAELEAEQIFATNGSGGLIYRNSKDELLIAPAFAPRIVDRTGAGDALMTLSSLMLSVGAPVDISAFYGNLAGAYVIQAIGNELTFSLSELNTEAEIALSLKGESLG